MSNKTVVILPGHGFPVDPGAVNQDIKAKEYIGTTLLSLAIKDMLIYNGFKVFLAREGYTYNNTDTNGMVNEQINFGNSVPSDIVIAIHFNSSVYKTAHGIETLYSTLNSFSNESKYLAELIQEELINATGLTDRGVKVVNSGVGVIKKIKRPTVLTENGFISNNEEYVWATNPDKIKILAEAHTKAICRYFGIEYKKKVEYPVVKIKVNNTEIEGLIINDISYAPVRLLLENLDKTVKWCAEESMVLILPKSYKPSVNGVNIGVVSTMFEGIIINKKSYAPVRLLAENFGFKVSWDAVNREVIITK